jgi:hypothetical protein
MKRARHFMPHDSVWGTCERPRVLGDASCEHACGGRVLHGAAPLDERVLGAVVCLCSSRAWPACAPHAQGSVCSVAVRGLGCSVCLLAGRVCSSRAFVSTCLLWLRLPVKKGGWVGAWGLLPRTLAPCRP